MFKSPLIGAVVLLAAAACSREDVSAPPGPQASLDAAEEYGEGQAIAETLCATCHAIGLAGESPHPDAKPFRRFSERYPISALEESFAEGIIVGHPDMPMWQFEPHQIDALLSYIQSVQDDDDA